MNVAPTHSTDDEEMRPLGSSARNRWAVSETRADLVRQPAPPRPITVQAEGKVVTLDLARTAIIIVDMQNDFCHKDGWLGHLGVDVTPARKPIAPLQSLLPALRRHDVPVIWVNWGNRPDRLNLSPAIVDELAPDPTDIHVAKYRMSGFQDTELDSILRNLGVTTLMFAGVNADQCVLCTLQDANFRGYDCLLLEDCAATTSPDYCWAATLYNVRQCFGFVVRSEKIVAELAGRERAVSEAAGS
jgi:nicotinamidase-related amidase